MPSKPELVALVILILFMLAAVILGGGMQTLVSEISKRLP
jgi:hypothetical protein